jgi:hypothetical protein
MMRSSILSALIVGMTMSYLAQSAIAQSGSATGKAAASSAVPRTADGKPDLTGVYQPASNRKGTWEEANSGSAIGGTGRDNSAPTPDRLARPTQRELGPYKPEAAKKVMESYNIRGIDDPTGICMPPGVPRSNSINLFPMQIVQTPTQLVILNEYMNTFRVIPINKRHPDDAEPTYMGDSVARWDGDTLVVDVTNFNDKTWLLGTGAFHTDALHVVERYTRVDKDTIHYDVVMEDSNVLTKPWEFHTTLMLREGTRLREYICAENNLDPERYQKMLKEGVEFRRK